jgi:hypothetical protein
VGYAEVGLLEGQPEVFSLADQKRPTDELVFAQIKHEGAWNVHPGSATALLMRLRRHTSVRVNLKRVVVDPESDDLLEFPFLYMTGLDDFSLSPEAVTSLQRYLQYEGVILINNGLGLSTFDKAVRRELRKILPQGRLDLIPAEHDMFRTAVSNMKVEYTPALAKKSPELQGRPYVLGMKIDGDLRVIYSPYDLEAGWLGAYYPLMLGYESVSARQLGINMITYVMIN